MQITIDCPQVPIASNYSDAEVLRAVQHNFPNPSPVLDMFIRRYERLLEAAGDQQIPSNVVQVNEEEDEHFNCPGCGVKLVASI